MNLRSRPRRNRRTQAIRNLVRETDLDPSRLIQPLFVAEGKGVRDPIASMPGQFRLSIDQACLLAKELSQIGISGVALFPVLPEKKKDKLATESKNRDGLLPRAIKAIKDSVPELLVITDVAMDPYSSDGHDGYLNDKGEIENDRSIQILCDMAIVQAKAGADWIAPSDMMDGRIGALRSALDQENLTQVSILAYAVKYASAFYGPFREALDSSPRSGDKKTYQMDPANRREALREVALDVREGADILMVKPALAYLDVIREVRKQSHLPIAAYQVSGEYSMIFAAAEKGWIDADQVLSECLISIRRAGADMILTYAAHQWAKLFHEQV